MKRSKEHRATGQGTPKNRGVNPSEQLFTKADFEDALRKVARRVSESGERQRGHERPSREPA